MDDLEKLYTDTRSPDNLKNIKQLQTTYKTNGLTANDINELSKTYGNEFSSDSFNKQGTPKT